MKTQTDNTKEQQSNNIPKVQQEQSTGGTATITDNRPATVYQRKLRAAMNNNSQNQATAQLRETMHASAAAKAYPVQRKANNTGLPDTLKTGIENLSGYAMDDVKVHYNSSKPAQLQAHAYAQGTDIHLAPGQEKHLPHEAWHVVQQKQGRVKPTMQLKGKVNVNDDAELEKEADVMGRRSLTEARVPQSMKEQTHQLQAVVQGEFWDEADIEGTLDAYAPQTEGPIKMAAIKKTLIAIQSAFGDNFFMLDKFPEVFMHWIEKRNGHKINIEELDVGGIDSKNQIKAGEWKVRHYTNYEGELKSTANVAALKFPTPNTRPKDWEKIGNQGYIFGIIVHKDKTPHRTWLKSAKYYYEAPLESFNWVWCSLDMINSKNSKKEAYSKVSTGVDLIKSITRGKAALSAMSMDFELGGHHEVKVHPKEFNEHIEVVKKNPAYKAEKKLW